MVLKFAFEYISSSQLFEKILTRILKASKLDGKIEKNKDTLLLYVQSENEEELINFANEVSVELPHSIFLKSSSVEALEKFPDDIYHELIIDAKPKAPFCPQCLKKSTLSYDPFVQCEACGYDVLASPLIFKNFAKTIQDDNRKIFENIAFVIKNGAIARVKTMNGFVLLGMLTENNYKRLQDGYEVLCVDLASVYKAGDVSDAQALAIGSFEKPIIRAFVTMDFREKHPYISQINIGIKMSDDLILELICQELKKLQIDYIFIAPNDLNHYPIELDFDSQIKYTTIPLHVTVLNDRTNIVLKGDRAILPYKSHSKVKSQIFATADAYTSYTQGNSIYISSSKDVVVPNDATLFTLQKENSANNLIFEACHGAFYSVMTQNSLEKNTSLGIYCSKEYPNKIMINSPKFGLVDYTLFSFGFGSVREILDAIKKEGKTAVSLVKNFQDRYQISEDVVFKKSDEYGGEIFLLWGAIAIILGIYKGDDLSKAGQRVLDLAQEFRGKKGPRIDYKTKEISNKMAIDSLWAIRTAMSFKLTDMDDLTLCYGIVESFAEFLSKQVDQIAIEHDLESICITGSLFESLKLLEHTYAHISKNNKVYFNKEIPMDKVNLGFGIIHVANL